MIFFFYRKMKKKKALLRLFSILPTASLHFISIPSRTNLHNQKAGTAAAAPTQLCVRSRLFLIISVVQYILRLIIT